MTRKGSRVRSPAEGSGRRTMKPAPSRCLWAVTSVVASRIRVSVMFCMVVFLLAEHPHDESAAENGGAAQLIVAGSARVHRSRPLAPSNRDFADDEVAFQVADGFRGGS